MWYKVPKFINMVFYYIYSLPLSTVQNTPRLGNELKKKKPSFPPGYFTFPPLWYHCLHESFIASELSNRVGLIRIEDFLGGMSVIS